MPQTPAARESERAQEVLRDRWWEPPKMWAGEIVFIIGGGPSLRGFDFSPLYGRRVIGCNDAYSLGHWVDICIFGDWGWWIIHGHDQVVSEKHGRNHPGLRRFPNLVVANTPLRNMVQIYEGAPGFDLLPFKRILPMHRRPGKMPVDAPRHTLVWHDNVGASAIHLALLLGAVRVVLLGFDMKTTKRKTNWHNPIKAPAVPKKMAFHRREHDLMALEVEGNPEFTKVDIVNVTPGSKLTAWPTAKFKDML